MAHDDSIVPLSLGSSGVISSPSLFRPRGGDGFPLLLVTGVSSCPFISGDSSSTFCKDTLPYTFLIELSLTLALPPEPTPSPIDPILSISADWPKKQSESPVGQQSQVHY
jgi:hypothetical protein